MCCPACPHRSASEGISFLNVFFRSVVPQRPYLRYCMFLLPLTLVPGALTQRIHQQRNSVRLALVPVSELKCSPTVQTWFVPAMNARAFRSLLSVPILGELTTFQFLPFQCSVSVLWLLFACWTSPTAQALVAESATGAARALILDPGLGLGVTAHWDPFQCRIKVVVGPTSPSAVPTAQAELAESAATPDNKLSRLPTLGLETTSHWEPSQCSTNEAFCMPLLPGCMCPTAQMSLAATAVTAVRALSEVPGLGLGTTLQLVPSQCSVSVRGAVDTLGSKCSPTAQASVGDVAVTPYSSLTSCPTLGLGVTLQLVPSQCSMSVWGTGGGPMV